MIFNKQKETQESDHTVSIEQLEKINKQLETQLTRKNEEFFRQFHKMMTTRSYRSGRQPVHVDHEILNHLIDGQKKGQTARQIYGTPSELADYVENAPTEKELAPPAFWVYWLESALFIGGLFSAVAGVMLFLSPESSQQNDALFGIVALIVNFILGGAAMAILNRYNMDAVNTKGKRYIFRYILLSIVVLLVWLGLLTLIVAFIPPQFNQTLPALGYVIIAVVAFLARSYVQKRYNISPRR